MYHHYPEGRFFPTGDCGKATGVYELAGILAHDPAGRAGGGDARGFGTAGRLLDRLLALAREISGRGAGGLAHRSASHGAGVLRVGGAWFAQPVWTLVAKPDRTHAGLYLCRSSDWIDCL